MWLHSELYNRSRYNNKRHESLFADSLNEITQREATIFIIINAIIIIIIIIVIIIAGAIIIPAYAIIALREVIDHPDGVRLYGPPRKPTSYPVSQLAMPTSYSGLLNLQIYDGILLRLDFCRICKSRTGARACRGVCRGWTRIRGWVKLYRGSPNQELWPGLWPGGVLPENQTQQRQMHRIRRRMQCPTAATATAEAEAEVKEQGHGWHYDHDTWSCLVIPGFLSDRPEACFRLLLPFLPPVLRGKSVLRTLSDSLRHFAEETRDATAVPTRRCKQKRIGIQIGRHLHEVARDGRCSRTDPRA